MAEMLAFCKFLEQTSIGAAVRQSLWLFPAIETVHLLGMTALLATIGAFDLRLAGFILLGERVSSLSCRLLPWAWAGFAAQVITGALLFSSEATHMVVNPAFRVKMILIILAGAHALIFHLAARRTMPAWDAKPQPPAAVRIAGLISLLLWIGVVAAGRWIGFI
jgi:hypothetical protein